MDLPIEIPTDIASVLKHYDLTNEAVCDLLRVVFKENTDEMANPVLFYMNDPRATLEEDVEILDFDDPPVTYDPATRTGKVWIGFGEFIDNGCSSINKSFAREEQVRFTVKFDFSRVDMHFPDPQERDPDDL